MRISRVALVFMLCCGCAPAPAVIPDAGKVPTPAVVLDIDGILTPRPLEFLEARPDAARAVLLQRGQRHLPGRLQVLQKLPTGVNLRR